MPELFKNRILEPTPKDQLYWFLNKVLSIKEIIILPFREYDELICFPPKLLKESGIFLLGKYNEEVTFDNEDQEYAVHVKNMLYKIKNDLEKLRDDYGLPSSIKNFTWEEDEGNFYDGGDRSFYFDLSDKPLFEAYLRFLDNDKIKAKNKDNKKYSETNEDILLETLGINIKGDCIWRGKEKTKINATDKALIYYLFYKSIKNEEECFTLKDLSEAKDIKKSKGYIENRIIVINKVIKKMVSREVDARIPKFIIKEKNKRGYQLNPKITHIKRKK